MDESSAAEAYRRRRDRAQEEAARSDSWSALAGNGRVLILAVSLVGFWVAHSRAASQPLALYGALAGLFATTLVSQDQTNRRRDRARLRALHYGRGLDRLAGRWRSFSSRGQHFDDPAHPYARDLDLFGGGSLFQLLDTTRTARGEGTLAAWLLAPSPGAEVLARRGAVQALAGDLDARERLAIAGLDAELSRIDETPLVAWCEGPSLFTPSAALIWVARALVPLNIASITLWQAGTLPVPPALTFVAISGLLLWRTRRQVTALGTLAESSEEMLGRLLPLLEAATTQPDTAPRLRDLTSRLGGAVAAIRSLRRRVTAYQSRKNLILAMLSPFLLWPFHSALLLQTWWSRHRAAARGWLEALGGIEALAAMATYASEHPGDTWPELSDGAGQFESAGLGHPLLDEADCVRNDVTLAGPGTALLVTGSNMSGKSTLLRAVGLNAIMALAGLPARASRLRLSMVQVASVMRVSDSLQEGASFFLAEVRRLKGVVDLADGGKPVLFLLDEILQGTNTRERSLGARGVIAHLIEAGAFGLVSTHDLSLVQLGDKLGARLQYAHFTDQVRGDQMTFDYRLRPGVVQTSNALRLMRAVGLEVEVPPE